MSFWREMTDGRLRRARALEASGDFRGAASLYAEMQMFVEAAKCLLHEGEKAGGLESRLGAWLDAAAILPAEAADLLREIDVRVGRAILAHRREHGVAGGEEKRQLADAAERLERSEQYRDAADAFELLRRPDDVARCLELGGEVDRLERVLTEQNANEERESRIRRLLSEHDLALTLGQRAAARKALREASALAKDDAAITTSLRRLEERFVVGTSVRLAVGEKRIRAVGRLPLVLGRSEADLVLRGGSVSRRHAEIAEVGGRYVVRDLGSRNGTLVAGVPLARDLVIAGPVEIGLGDDVLLQLRPSSTGISLEVVRGLDRGEVVAIGAGIVAIEELGAVIRFEAERTTLVVAPGTRIGLGGRSVGAEVDLLRGDVLLVDGTRVEVLS